jgi:hypothetical protein
MGRREVLALPFQNHPLDFQLRLLRKIAGALGYMDAEVWIGDVLHQQFVWAEGYEVGPRVMLLEGARLRGWTVIRCSKCDQSAASLDSFHPYHDELTLCLEHYKAR